MTLLLFLLSNDRSYRKRKKIAPIKGTVDLPLTDVTGVGVKTAQKLVGLGVHSVEQVATMTPLQLKKQTKGEFSLTNLKKWHNSAKLLVMAYNQEVTE
jgi:predicted flap endonuclease-1-like 5' DNA nuclease